MDILEGNSNFTNEYTTEEKDNFIKYINDTISKLDGEKEPLFNLFIKMYAAPVKNKVLQTA
jgi:hypothetical protein